jgi:hypothetical protein
LTVWECAIKGPQRRTVEDVARDAAEWLRSGRGNWSIAPSHGSAARDHRAVDCVGGLESELAGEQ